MPDKAPGDEKTAIDELLELKDMPGWGRIVRYGNQKIELYNRIWQNYLDKPKVLERMGAEKKSLAIVMGLPDHLIELEQEPGKLKTEMEGGELDGEIDV